MANTLCTHNNHTNYFCCYLSIVQKFNRNTEYKKAAVPKKDEKPIHGLVSDKNFIVANAVENILAGK